MFLNRGFSRTCRYAAINKFSPETRASVISIDDTLLTMVYHYFSCVCFLSYCSGIRVLQLNKWQTHWIIDVKWIYFIIHILLSQILKSRNFVTDHRHCGFCTVVLHQPEINHVTSDKGEPDRLMMEYFGILLSARVQISQTIFKTWSFGRIKTCVKGDQKIFFILEKFCFSSNSNNVRQFLSKSYNLRYSTTCVKNSSGVIVLILLPGILLGYIFVYYLRHKVFFKNCPKIVSNRSYYINFWVFRPTQDYSLAV